MDVNRRYRDQASLVLERELAHIADGIEFVAGGGATRIVLAGLRFGEPLLEAAQEMARASGVRLVPLWSSDESGVDIAIERADDD